MDWNEPTNSNPAHPNVLADLNSKDTYAVTLGQTNAGFTNIPEGAMNWDHGSKFFRRKEGGAFLPVQISLSGGGTGASDAAGARTALEVNKAGQGTAEARTNQQNDQVYCQLSRSVNTASPLQGGGQLDSDVNLSIQDATTAQKGAVQLDNTLTSTSTTKALTAAQGKALDESLSSVNNSLSNEIALLGQDRISFKADWDGANYTALDILGANIYWNITSSGLNKISLGVLRVNVPSEIGQFGYTVSAMVVDSSPHIVTVSGITSTRFDLYVKNLSGVGVDQDLLITISRTRSY